MLTPATLVNDNARILNARGVHGFFASRLAPTVVFAADHMDCIHRKPCGS